MVLPHLLLICIAGFVVGRLMNIGVCQKRYRQYLFIELVNALGWVLIGYYWGVQLPGLAGMAVFSAGLMISVIDLKYYIIPNRLIVLFLVTGFIYHYLAGSLSFMERFWGFTTGFGGLFLLSVISRGGIGGGDIKLAGVMGFWLGSGSVLQALFIGALAGSITGLALIMSGVKQRKEAIPFGPFLIIGFLIVYYFIEINGLSV